MKQIEKTASATNFTAINLGKLNELGDYLLELAPEIKIPGKVFGGAALQATGSEFSFQLFQPGTETGFLHTHQTHEELKDSIEKTQSCEAHTERSGDPQRFHGKCRKSVEP